MNFESVTRITPTLFDDAHDVREELLQWSVHNDNIIQDNPVEPPNLGNDRAVASIIIRVTSYLYDIGIRKYFLFPDLDNLADELKSLSKIKA